jgi:beta-N-acetylhexosaminidase
VNLRADVGQLLLVGFDGETLAPLTRGALERGERAGVVLFRRNVPTFEATTGLCADVQLAARRGGADLPALVAIDQEGGRVTRLPAPFPKLPPMRVLAGGGVELVRDAARLVGRSLAHLGVNFDLAPVLDVDSNPANPVIGDRSFSRDPLACARLAVAFAEGLAAGGVLACGKHFPGHGDTSTDSHLALPVLDHDRARLDAVELVPFVAAVRSGMDSLMTAHVVCEAIDPGVPATLSRRLCTDLLRGELGFRGALLSDDLEMRAVAALHPPAESAILSVQAGCDAVLVCRDELAAEAAFASLLAEAERSPAFRGRVAEAAGRMRTLRRTAAERAPSVAPPRAGSAPAPWDEPEAQALMARALALGEVSSTFDPTEHGR